MWLELLSLSAAVMGLLIALTFPKTLRHVPAYWMMVGTGALAGIAWLGMHSEPDSTAWKALASLAVFAMLLMRFVAPFLRRLGYWCIAKEYLALASICMESFAVLQPGLGGERDRAMVRAYRQAVFGNVDVELSRLASIRAQAPKQIIPILDAQGIWLLLLARQYERAIAYAEEKFPQLAIGAEADLPYELRVQLLAAYLWTGQDDKLAANAQFLLDRTQELPQWGVLHQTVGLVALAAAGRLDAATAWSTGMQGGKFAQVFWRAVAAARAGDAVAAKRLAVDATAAATTARQRDNAASVITLLGRPTDDELTKVAVRLEGQKVPKAARHISNKTWPVWLLAAICVLWAVAATVWGGGIDDSGTAIKFGASVRALVEDGQWWRWVTSLFVHLGWGHLLINLMGLFVLGGLASRIYGTRVLTIFVVAGVMSAIASSLRNHALMSMGASGAIMALSGAVTYASWRLRDKLIAVGLRGDLFRQLLLITGLQVVLDLMVPMSDGVAHLAGFVAGFALAPFLLPTTLAAPDPREGSLRGDSPAKRVSAGVLATLAALAIGYGVFGFSQDRATAHWFFSRIHHTGGANDMLVWLPSRMQLEEPNLFLDPTTASQLTLAVAEGPFDPQLFHEWITRELSDTAGFKIGANPVDEIVDQNSDQAGFGALAYHGDMSGPMVKNEYVIWFFYANRGEDVVIGQWISPKVFAHDSKPLLHLWISNSANFLTLRSD